MKSTITSVSAVALLAIASTASAVDFTVTTTANGGAGSLREAIGLANGNAGPDEIHFAIPGPGPHTISIAAVDPLPAITDEVIIDGLTQPGAACNTNPVTAPLDADLRIVLDGSATLAFVNGLVLAAGSDGSTIRGLVIRDFTLSGIVIDDSSGNHVNCNFIGTDVAGTTAEPNILFGVAIIGASTNNTIGTDGDAVADDGERNLISGNLLSGVFIEADGNTVAGNFIGVDASGAAALGNGTNGVLLFDEADDNLVGTDGDGVSDMAERNVISANGIDGVRILDDCLRNTVAGNFIGTDLTGTAALGNGGDGVCIEDDCTDNVVGTNGDGSPGDAVEGNVIAASGEDGVEVEEGSANNTIAGNTIGTDVTGTVDLGNTLDGVCLEDSAGNVVGTDGDGVSDVLEGNLISGNGDDGIEIDDSSSDLNVIAGNMIGTDMTGTVAIPNGGNGIEVDDGDDTIIGTNSDGTSDDLEGNLISGNGDDGIEIESGADRTIIAGNLIGVQKDGTTALGNGGDGVDLQEDNISDTRIGSDNDGTNDAGEANVIANSVENGVEIHFVSIAPGSPAFDGTGEEPDDVEDDGDAPKGVAGPAGPTPGGSHVQGAARDGNTISRNSIYDNGGLGIDLAPLGAVNPNDPDDPDAGANGRQNYPVLLTVSGTGDVTGTLDSVPATDFRIEFFWSTTPDPSTFGEGQTYAATIVVTTASPAAINTNVPTVAGMKWLTATATNMDTGDTSEFSNALPLPNGACCMTNGTCMDITAPDCAVAGGAYQGDFINCTTIECPQACCLSDGSCASLTIANCIAATGTPQGAGTTCAAVACPQACCLKDGSCALLLPVQCTAQGGVPQGVGPTCLTANCPQPGACCLPDGSCFMDTFLAGADCVFFGGIYQGDNTACATVACPQPNTGACCNPADGTCLVISAMNCTGLGGTYQGHNSSCAGVACPQPPTGACCFFSGDCSVLTPFDCDVLGGTYRGDGVTCAAAACPLPNVTSRAGASQKGSLFIFHKVELRWGGAAPYPLLQDTFLSLTNDHNQSVQIHMQFINGDAPRNQYGWPNDPFFERAHPGWNSLDNGITLTANQPTYWSALTGQPANGGLSPFTALDPGMPPGRPAMDGTTDRVLRGYIVGWAVDSNHEEISWNHLAGNGTIVHYANGSSWEYDTTNYAVVSGAATGQPSDGTPGRLRLDGTEYAPSPAQLLLNFQASGSMAFGNPGLGAPRQVMSDSDLTLHPVSVDLRQETDGPVTTKASFEGVWNQNEVKFSGLHRCVTCWDQQLFSLYATLNNHLLRSQLQTDHGKARIDGLSAPQCDEPYNGVFSRSEPLVGVAMRLLLFDPGLATQDVGQAGYNLVFLGHEAALIQYDLPGGSSEAQGPALPSLPFGATREDLEKFIEAILETASKK